MVDALQKWAVQMAILDPVRPMAHYGSIRMDPTLRIPSFDHKSRFYGRSLDELMMGDVDPSDAAVEYGRGDGQGGTTNPNGGEEAGGCALNGFLHVLTEMTHLGRLGILPNNGLRMRSSIAQADGGELGSSDHDIERIGSGYQVDSSVRDVARVCNS
jgi:hypothetical protein